MPFGCSPAEAAFTRGVEVPSLGVTKNDALAAEAVVLVNPKLERELAFPRKRARHFWSKLRLQSAQSLASLAGDLRIRHAQTASALATRFAAGLAAAGGRLAAGGEGR